MLTELPTQEMIENWKQTFQQYRPVLSPNRKSASEMVAYLKSKYDLTEIDDNAWKQVVIDGVLLNEPFAAKLPLGSRPNAVVFAVQDRGNGEVLYRQQDKIFEGQQIVVGIEL